MTSVRVSTSGGTGGTVLVGRAGRSLAPGVPVGYHGLQLGAIHGVVVHPDANLDREYSGLEHWRKCNIGKQVIGI